MDLSLVKLILQVILGVTGVLLVLLVLLHRGRGGGLSDMFGGGISAGAGSSGVAERNLNRITVTIGVIWGLSAIALGIVARVLAVTG